MKPKNDAVTTEIIKNITNGTTFILNKGSLFLTDQIYNRRFKILILEAETEEIINSYAIIKIKNELVEIESTFGFTFNQFKEIKRILTDLKHLNIFILKKKIKDIFRLDNFEEVQKNITIRDWMVTKMRKIKNKLNYDLIKYKKKYHFIKHTKNEKIDSKGNLNLINENKLQIGGRCIYFN